MASRAVLVLLGLACAMMVLKETEAQITPSLSLLEAEKVLKCLDSGLALKCCSIKDPNASCTVLTTQGSGTDVDAVAAAGQCLENGMEVQCCQKLESPQTCTIAATPAFRLEGFGRRR
ncbi:uncharacterized protein PAF06_015976 [Gastrophryne carolinensis]